MKYVSLILCLVAVLALNACSGSGGSAPVLGPDGQPTGQTVQQPNGPGVGTGAILGGLAGFMLGRATGGGGGNVAGPSTHTTVIERHRTVVVQQPAPKSTFTKPNVPSYSKPSVPRYSAPSRPSFSRPSYGGYRGGRR